MSSTISSTTTQSALTAGGYVALGGGGGGAIYAGNAHKKLNAVNSDLVQARTPVSDQQVVQRTAKYVSDGRMIVRRTNEAPSVLHKTQLNLRPSKVDGHAPMNYNPTSYRSVDRQAGSFRTLRKALTYASIHRKGVSTGFREQNGRIALVNLNRTMDKLNFPPAGFNPAKDALAFKPDDKALAAVTDASGKRLRRIGGSAPLTVRADELFRTTRNRWLGAGAAVLAGYALLNAGTPKST